MRPQDNRGSSRRSGRGPRRQQNRSQESRPSAPSAPQKPSAKPGFWQRLLSFFRPSPAKVGANGRPSSPPSDKREPRFARKPELVEVTSSKLYVGNLSYEATESDLFELFKGVGIVKNAEVVCHKYNDRSKGFGFVTMTTVDEAKRAVTELHDKDFMGRKLVVSGAKTNERETNYRG